ncbi:D-aspartate oxidase {} [Coccidioides immitis H538.4]|uniref:D-aspartate oxidase () n=1 Tax=Coccidioides immitis H538.4 TaxID=396776 RepID=A0A0J8S2X4_COCIT|nr:D-aspartate oxidase {} [Coccidioides immitis H538.4]
MAPPKSHIMVVGAGVIGLQTSLSLLEAGYEVTIVAEHFPGDVDDMYTSPRAGGQWRSHALPGQEQCEWDIQTFKCWKAIVEEEEKTPDLLLERRSGLAGYESNLYWDDPSHSPEILATKNQDPSNLWWAPYVPGFSRLQTPFPSANIKAGVTYKSFSFDPPRYIKWLFRRVLLRGIKTVHTKLPTSKGLPHALHVARAAALEECRREGRPFSIPVLFVNATGLGARNLVPDAAVHPVRGQTLLVRGEAHRIYTHVMSAGTHLSNEQIAYALPRNGTGTSLVGGSKQVGAWDTTEDAQLSETILQWAKRLAPELCGDNGELDVLSVQVALRPGRTGGARVEKEILKGCGEDGDDLVIIHSYGHGGSGFQNSVGSATKVVNLVEEHLDTRK